MNVSCTILSTFLLVMAIISPMAHCEAGATEFIKLRVYYVELDPVTRALVRPADCRIKDVESFQSCNITNIISRINWFKEHGGKILEIKEGDLKPGKNGFLIPFTTAQLAQNVKVLGGIRMKTAARNSMADLRIDLKALPVGNEGKASEFSKTETVKFGGALAVFLPIGLTNGNEVVQKMRNYLNQTISFGEPSSTRLGILVLPLPASGN